MSNTQRSKRSTARFLLAGVVGLALASGCQQTDAQQAPDPEKMKVLQQMMQKQIALMTPEMQQKVKALSPENKQALLKIYSQHTRHSDQISLRHVMHEVLADFQSTLTGIATDNAEQTAASARRLANHRIPRGGLLPYLKLEDVTNEKVSALVPFNDSVEGNALRLAEAAEKGDMALAAKYMGEVTSGCVACHQVFRGRVGATSNLQD